ncbi:restriction endonuclease subunit R, partial [bacterium]
LNFAVQRTIDRIIFLRMCEDRGIEPDGQLLALLNGENTYKRLQYHYNLADDKYNSGLFHFKPEKGRAEAPDELTLRLKIDDKVLKDIIRRLYYPESPYEFSVLGADILGNVYEQFLGKVIRLTAGHHAVVEDKPEVKKAGGVYYTPAYIVDYIVKNTVGKLCEGKTPKQISGLRILDPACGSGSFLIGAYTYLLNYHRDWYVNDGQQKHTKEIYQGTGGQWLLTTQEKKRILLNNTYGVDIDSQAVEVTKLSLLLKVLEGESEETIGKSLKLFRERALPDLGSNIKCGNSLIGPDFYKNQQLSLLDEEEHYRINIFDWDAEFREIMTAGGFDAVIGNPPYLNVDDTWGHGDKRLAALKALYPQIYNDKTDILFYFLAKATQLSKGYVGFIVSRAFLEAYKADKLRGYLLANSSLKKLVDFRNFYVFPGVGITTCVTVTQPKAKPGLIEVYKLRGDSLPASNLESLLSDPKVFEKLDIKQSELEHAPWNFSSKEIQNLNAKIDAAGKPLEKILLIGQGMQTGRNDVFGERTLKEIKQWRLKTNMFYKRASNSDIQRFYFRDRGEYLLFLEDEKSFDSL